nr:zinc dependent phospholipase C family protein [uncultured Sphingomonas sp.]
MKLSILFRGLLSFSIVVGLLLPGAPAHAFKVQTHVWIAQQVINDLAAGTDGSLQFAVGDRMVSVPVPERVRRAILAYPEAFRIGSIGPDAFPGIYEGQMVIHPGDAGASWGTGDWLELLLKEAKTDEEIAFVYGMLCHAAADIWAHSYVNHYAGNIWLLTNGEVEVEVRHFLLEGYIANHAPALMNGAGRSIGTASQLIKRRGSYAVPLDFVYRVFVENDGAARAFGSAGSVHILGVHNLNKGLEKLTVQDGPADQLHQLIQKIVIQRLLDYNISTEQLKHLNAAHQKLLSTANGAIDKLQETEGAYRAQLRKTIVKANAQAEGYLDDAERHLGDAAKLVGEKQRIESEILRLSRRFDVAKRLRHRVPYPSTECVKKVFGRCVVHRPVIKYKTIKDPSEAVIDRALAAQHRLETGITRRMLASVARARSAIAQAHKTGLAIYDAETSVSRGLVDLAQQYGKDENPIKGLLLAWRDNNVAAMKSYFIANIEAMDNSMKGGDVLAPLSRWLSCDALSFTGIPVGGLRAGCKVKDAFAELQKLLDLVERIDPVSAEVARLRDRIEGDVRKLVQDKAIYYSSKLLDVDLKTLIAALRRPATAQGVDAVFSMGDNLLKPPSMSTLADRDMALDRGGKFDPARFAIVYNARTLSRLALLDPSGLNRIAGRGAYAASIAADGNILFRFARSIDGDYQWLPDAPPYARADGKHVSGGRYGYPGGMRYWAEADLRDQVFRKLFIGPVAPGLSVGVEGSILPEDYPYRPSLACPFPDFPAAHPCVSN